MKLKHTLKYVSSPIIILLTLATLCVVLKSKNNKVVNSVSRLLLTEESTIVTEVTKWPEIVWLLSFPNSGTFYTLVLSQIASGKTTATNYGNEVANVGITYLNNPEFSYSPNGPFRGSRRPLPSTYILTKTHCAGQCRECSPLMYTVNYDEFYKGCGVGVRSKMAVDDESPFRNVRVVYNGGIVKKVVHLIRSPFDNVVARFHYSYEVHKQQGDESFNYSWNKEGFKEYCQYLDTQFAEDLKQILGEELFAKAKGVPCHTIFHQYIQWHNHAFAISRNNDLPTLIIYYEDYSRRAGKITTELLEFLEQERVGGIRQFNWNGGYINYYSQEEIMATITFLKAIADNKTYERLKWYFDPKVLQQHNI